MINKQKYDFYKYLKFIKYNYPVKPCVVFNQLLKSQYWSKEEIINFQLNELNKLLLISKNTSCYYKKLFSNIDLPIKKLDEFNKKISSINKDIIKIHFNELKTKNFTTSFKHQTSGTTGDPIIIYTSALAEAYREASFLRFLNWWNIKPFEKSVRIGGRKKTYKTGTIKEALISKLKQRYDVNVFDLREENINKYYNDIKKYQPAYLRGYKSAIFQFAELLENKKLFFNNFKLKLIIVTSEVLLESERKYIENILDSKVVNEYGSAETGQIAFECPHGSMHIVEEAVYVNTNHNNQIFLTEIHNDSMPLINYMNKDRVVLSNNSCNCGINSRVISCIEGRDDDCLIKPNGEKISTFLSIYIIMELDEIGLGNSILKYKIIQRQNKFKILIVPKKDYNNDVEKYIKKRFYEEIGNDITIEFNLVNSIPRDKSGKLKFFTRID